MSGGYNNNAKNDNEHNNNYDPIIDLLSIASLCTYTCTDDYLHTNSLKNDNEHNITQLLTYTLVYVRMQ